MPTVLITGGTGLIGTALTEALVKKGYSVIILSRNPEKQQSDNPLVSFAKWDLKQQAIDNDAINKSDFIIHLAGANVGEGRWTEKRKKEIVESRTRSSELILKGLKENPNKVKAVISASGVGWYGPDKPGKDVFVETDPAFNDFLGETCKVWEGSIQPVTELNKRLVILRTGIALSNKGGALKEFKRPLNFGVATILGNGKQVVSWIHIDDLVRIYLHAIENENVNGIYNATAPSPVTNKELILELAKQKQTIYIPFKVPEFILKTVLGEMSIEILKSATASSKKLQDTRFTFLYPTIKSAMEQLVG